MIYNLQNYLPQLINIDYDIYSITHSQKYNQIYLCLLNQMKVKILNYDLGTKKEITISKKEIISNKGTFYVTHFNKCCKISNDFIATIDDNSISLWSERDENYENIKNFEIGKTSDILLMDNNNFITSQP